MLNKPLAKLSTAALGKKSTGGATLDKASIISLAKRSTAVTDARHDSGPSLTTVSPGSGSTSADDLPWHAMPNGEVAVRELVSSPENGLSSKEAATRLSVFGPNRLTPAAKPGLLARVWREINNVLIWLLLAAAVVEGALESWAEFGLILLVVVLNTAIGIIQEGKAEKAAEAIKAMLSPNAMVMRDGEAKTIPAEELVPGDIVLIKSGDKIPADLRLLQSTNLQVQEAMLTGESVPAAKNLHPAPAAAGLGDRKCMCFSATAVVSGQARGVVVATGDSAEIGQINKMVNTVETTKNNLVRQLEILGRWLAVLVLIIAVVSFLLAKLRAEQSFGDAFESAVAIAVAIIPEGLPAVVTIVLAIGTTVMARHNAIIRQLPAVETLGSLTVICSDKTGTLTKNEMTVVSVRTASSLYKVSGVGYAPTGTYSLVASSTAASPPAKTTAAAGDGGKEEALSVEVLTDISDDAQRMSTLRSLLEGTVLCNDSTLSRETDDATGRTTYSPLGAPTEVALVTAAEKAGIAPKDLKAARPRVASVPFESEHKFMATVHEEEGSGRRVIYVKGAPDRLLPLCRTQVVGDDLAAEPAPLDPHFWQEAQASLSSQGLRVLALCRAEVPPTLDLESINPSAVLSHTPFLSMVLMVAILDPPREEAVVAIKVAHRAGITVKMITGDHSLTALAIGGMLGLTTGGPAGAQRGKSAGVAAAAAGAPHGGSVTVITGPEVDRMDDDALRLIVMGCNIFARASPENKLRIVRALQELNQTVAMTGDGVNDAPALKRANVGVAMGITGTDVSKEAAKMVLADDNFATIVAAVREGRRVWDNIRKILIFNLPVNLAQGTSILYSYILGLDNVPLTALQILLVNLVTSVTLGLALAAEPPEPTVMDRPPRRVGKRLVGKLLLWRMFFVCHVVVSMVIGMFYWGQETGLELKKSRAEAFNVLVGCQVTYFINCRFIKLASFHPRVFRGNSVAPYTIALVLGLMMFITYTPKVNEFFHMEGMEGVQWARTFVCMIAVFTIVEVEKALVDPVLMPIIRPVLAFFERHTPSWLSVDATSGAITRGFKACAGAASCGKATPAAPEAEDKQQAQGVRAYRTPAQLKRVMSSDPTGKAAAAVPAPSQV